MLKEILMLFVPGAAGVLIYRFLEKTQWNFWDYIEYYSLFSFSAYFLARTVFYLSGLQEFSVRTLDFNVQIKFGILSMVCAAAAAGIIHFVRAVWKGNKVFKHE